MKAYTGERLKTLLKFTLCIDECEQEWNTKLNELISVSSVGVCHCLTAIPRQNRISQVAFATVWESGFNSSCQSTQDRKFFFLVCQRANTISSRKKVCTQANHPNCLRHRDVTHDMWSHTLLKFVYSRSLTLCLCCVFYSLFDSRAICFSSGFL